MSITISFECKDSNQVLLLTTLYDFLNIESVDDSISMIDNAAWLVDEIGDRLNEVDQFDTGDKEHRLEGLALEVAKLYHRDE